MVILWETRDMVAAMNGRPFGQLPQTISGISIDSRNIAPNEAFFAIKGDRVDGHDFASLAAANGASVLVISEAKLPALGHILAPKIVVRDVLEALEKLAVAARERARGRVIAVTGSVGKTTTKEMLRHVLSACGKVHFSPASFNNHWGVPLTLARLPREYDFGVFEIGMNHPGEIRPLVKMVRPHVAIITTIAPAHLGNFSGLEEIAAAKAEIFEGVAPGGHVLINRDNSQYEFLENAAVSAGVTNIHSFGTDARADFRLIDYQQEGDQAVFWATIGGRTFEVPIRAPGRHIAENAVAVLGACMLAGADLNRIIPAFAEVSPAKGRGERLTLQLAGGSFTVIDESYNANPASMRAAIALLAATEPGPDGRRIAVLGDMLEMGEHAADVHRALADPLFEHEIQHVWLAGTDMAHLRDELGEDRDVVYLDDADQLAAYAAAHVRPGDVLMIKSSNGVGFSRIVAHLKEKYSPAIAPDQD